MGKPWRGKEKNKHRGQEGNSMGNTRDRQAHNLWALSFCQATSPLSTEVMRMDRSEEMDRMPEGKGDVRLVGREKGEQKQGN